MFRNQSSFYTFEPDKKLSDFDVDKQTHKGYDRTHPVRKGSIGKSFASKNDKLQMMQGVGEPGQFCLTLRATLSRHYSVHLFRVGFVMALFSLASVATMMPHDQSTSMERITLLVTLMLTATTYSLVVAESLPTLPYLTLIDKYVLGTFAYFGMIGLELATIDWSEDLDWPSEVNGTIAHFTLTSGGGEGATYRATFVNLVFWVLLHSARFVAELLLLSDANGSDAYWLQTNRRVYIQ
jgi:hypothetical protein